jgi:hypothetical protein
VLTPFLIPQPSQTSKPTPTFHPIYVSAKAILKLAKADLKLAKADSFSSIKK